MVKDINAPEFTRQKKSNGLPQGLQIETGTDLGDLELDQTMRDHPVSMEKHSYQGATNSSIASKAYNALIFTTLKRKNLSGYDNSNPNSNSSS